MLWAEVKKFGYSDTGKGIVLFIIPGGRSIALKVVAARPPPGMVEATVMFFSSNFAEKTTAGLDTPFMAQD